MSQTQTTSEATKDSNVNRVSVISLAFSDSKIPSFKKKRGQNYVPFGDENNYPDYLIYLLNKSPKHNAIVHSKATYIYGGGLMAENESIPAKWFINQNSKLIKKLILDVEAFGVSYIQAIPNKGMSGYVFYPVAYQKIRSNESGTMFYFKHDWADRMEEKIAIPAFEKGLKRSSIICIKEQRPGVGVYGLPNFISSCNYIEADIEVSKHTLTNAKTGFAASKVVNFYNGEPTEPVKRAMEEKFNNKFTGAEGKKIILSFNNAGVEKPTIDDLGASDLTKEDFSAIDNMIATNIYAGHQITNPALFGVPNPDHSLGGNAGAELRVSYDIFKNTYVAGKKAFVEDATNFLASLNGVTDRLSLIDVEPVGYQFSEATLLKTAPRSWITEKLGIDLTKYTDAPIEVAAAPTAPAATQQQNSDKRLNGILLNLTGKQQQQLDRIIRKCKNGTMERNTAALMLKSGFDFSDEEVDIVLGSTEAFSAEELFSNDEDVALLFSVHGESADLYEVFEKKLVTFETFADAYSDLESKIKILYDKNPKASAESIAKTLNVDVKLVESYLAGLSGGGVGGAATKLPKFEVRYSYEKRPDVEGPSVLPTTRPFCKKMVGLNRLYTRKDIQKISQYLGYDVMKRAGGFWNNNGTVEYHCRHEFFSQIVIKKK